MGFSGGDPESHRADAHTHVASHHPGTQPTSRDAFLPPEVVAKGQMELQRRLLVKCVSLAMTSKDFGGNGSSDAGLGLLLVATDLADLELNVADVWDEAEASITGGESVATSGSASSQSSPPPLPLEVSDGGIQLASALKTHNLHGCRQIMQAFKDNLNCNFIDEESGHPLTSLALLFRQKSIVVQLLRRGADPLLRSLKVPRSVLYIAIEIGMLDVVKLIFELNPSIDMNSSITDEEKKGYHPIHVAARYNHGHIVKYLVSKGADIHIKELELGYTPILLALVLKHSWAARELILLGSNLLEAGTAGRTSLFIIAEKVLSSCKFRVTFNFSHV